MEKPRMDRGPEPEMDCHPGFVSHGICLPEKVETKETLAARWGMDPGDLALLGIEERPCPGPGDQPVTMASRAALQALDRAPEIDPLSVDLVLWTGEEYKDYICQTAAIRLQEETGCRNAWAFDLVGQGVTLLQGIRVARDLMAGDAQVRTVLLAGGTRNGDLVDPHNPDTAFLLPLSGSGGAMLLKRDHGENRLRSTAFLVDPEMADAVYVPGGGTERPFSPEILGSPLLTYRATDPEALSAYLENAHPKRMADCITHALHGERADFLALRHLAPRHRKEVLRILGIPDPRSPALSRLGCHGTNDPLLSLDMGLRAGHIQNGHRVVLAASGIGFTYAAVVFSWGKA